MSPGGTAAPPPDAGTTSSAVAAPLLAPPAIPPRQGTAAATAAAGPLATGSQAPPGSPMPAGGVAVKRESEAAVRLPPLLSTAATETAPLLDTPGMQRALKSSPDAAAVSAAAATGQGPEAPLRLDDLMLLSGAPAPTASIPAATTAADAPGPPEASHAAAEAGQCPICLEDLAGLTLHVYPCGHTFCEACSTKVRMEIYTFDSLGVCVPLRLHFLRSCATRPSAMPDPPRHVPMRRTWLGCGA